MHSQHTPNKYTQLRVLKQTNRKIDKALEELNESMIENGLHKYTKMDFMEMLINEYVEGGK